LARPLHFTDDALLLAAYEVFRDHGMEATTAEIAKRAGASEGTLFKRFTSKWGLFHAVMEKTGEVGLAWTLGLAARVGRGALADELEDASNEGIDFFRLVVPIHMISGISRQHTKMLSEAWAQEHPALTARRRIEGYFEAERRSGRIGKVDVEVTARIFQGTLYNFAVSELLTGPYESSPLPQEKFVRHFVGTLLAGIVRPGERSSPLSHTSSAPAKKTEKTPAKKTATKKTATKKTATKKTATRPPASRPSKSR
jgi:AcrR family transcriptional regulator